MQISNENSGISSLARQNILEKANQAFSGGERAEDFSKKINDAINSVADSQNKASQITKDYELGKRNWLNKSYYATADFKYRVSNDFKC